jgi:hypothetical protein
VLLATLIAVAATSCGGHAPRTAADIQACVKEHLPSAAVDRTFVSTEEGVTSLTYLRRGDETIVTIFKSSDDAIAAVEAEARIGDAHDKRIDNVLYNGGGSVVTTLTSCLR